ncbi:pheromone A receptor-domain-containing protein [Microdochium bolleyi]|uniref:Pheromone A receptor-domain-containing protein n=1 Tax=Microdochium bolleyi TaxID=196109 RepID=A0A136JCA6_9PEZI|nr:pheromone A receptor-domain-containing protein [Microdochium bolleyi]
MSATSSTSSSLEANRVLRIFLAVVGTILCHVPFRLLLHNKQYAAVVLITAVGTMNFFTILNASIWPDDNYASWWHGHGLCDIQVYLAAPLQTVYAASIFAIMRRLASQMRLSTRPDLDAGDSKKLLVEAGIIFGIPAFQLMFTHFDLAQRYIVGTLVGCSAVYDRSWPKALVFDTPPAIFAVASVPFAYIMYTRYRIVARAASVAFSNGVNLEACQRVARTRRRLYRMCLSILVLYVPFMLYFFAVNLRDTIAGSRPYDYRRMRSGEGTPYPWHAILFVPSWLVPASTLEQPWIAIVTSFVIVAFFGATNDALRMWQDIGHKLGLKVNEHIDLWTRALSSPQEKSFAEFDDRISKPQGHSLSPLDKPEHNTYQTRSSRHSFDADLLVPSPPSRRPETPSYSPASDYADWSSPQPLLPRKPPRAHHKSYGKPASSPLTSSGGATIKLSRTRLGRVLPPLPTLESSSALEDSYIIASVIPPRGSSLQHRGAALCQALRTPTLPRMPTITMPALPTLSSSSFSGMLSGRLTSWGCRRLGSRRTEQKEQRHYTRLNDDTQQEHNNPSMLRETKIWITTPPGDAVKSATSVDTAIIRGVRDMTTTSGNWPFRRGYERGSTNNNNKHGGDRGDNTDDDDHADWLTEHDAATDDAGSSSITTQNTTRATHIHHSNIRRGRGRAIAVPLLRFVGAAAPVEIPRHDPSSRVRGAQELRDG